MEPTKVMTCDRFESISKYKMNVFTQMSRTNRAEIRLLLVKLEIRTFGRNYAVLRDRPVWQKEKVK